MPPPTPVSTPVAGSPWTLASVVRRTGRALEQLLGGMGTALLALGVLAWSVLVALSCVAGVGLLLVPSALRLVHAISDRERLRLHRWGSEVPVPAGRAATVRAAAADEATRRELIWLARHAVMGSLVGFLALLLPVFALRDLSVALWWWALPDGWASPSLGLWIVGSWPEVPAVVLLGAFWVVVTIVVLPPLARRQDRIARRFLSSPDVDLSLRVAELTATRAAALDAHTTELRRIERALHDGTQNRLVAATVLLGAARRSVATGSPEAVDAMLGRAQDAAELALAELRAVVRSILPPVLADRGLTGAVRGLAASTGMPVKVDLTLSGRSPAAVEATVYYTVAEALTNVARHSHASRASVVVRQRDASITVIITDDGRGGAAESLGSGLEGVRRRVEAMDGAWSLTSPAGGPTIIEAVLPCAS